MSEKFNSGIWRKIKDRLSLCIAYTPTVLMEVGSSTLILLICSVFSVALARIFWNIFMTTLFGFQNITFFQAFVLKFTFSCIKCNYSSISNFVCAKIEKEIFNECKNKNMSKDVSMVFSFLLTLISYPITTLFTIYSWNNILPQLLNVELVQINLFEAFMFTILLHGFL